MFGACVLSAVVACGSFFGAVGGVWSRMGQMLGLAAEQLRPRGTLPAVRSSSSLFKLSLLHKTQHVFNNFKKTRQSIYITYTLAEFIIYYTSALLLYYLTRTPPRARASFFFFLFFFFLLFFYLFFCLFFCIAFLFVCLFAFRRFLFFFFVFLFSLPSFLQQFRRR